MRPFKVNAATNTAEVLIYEDIGAGWFGGLTAKDFAKELKALPKTVDMINVRLNSSGGDVFEGTAIYNLLKSHKARVTVDVDGAALSIASVIAMAADPGGLRMAGNAWMMIHDPWSAVLGDAGEMRKMADLLDGIKDQIVSTYASRTGREREDIAQWMSEETWMSSEDAHELGFADEVLSDLAVAAAAAGKWCQHVPEAFSYHREMAARMRRERCDELRTRLDKINAFCVK